MWPQTLEMSREECRGMLRRLELESYSHIISVFRAQGSLSESKTKMLEELRQLFHITQERHRAEVRRAANDEQLCTIAENVCGPNTWQEWSREGRRPYPLLPRICPQTAMSIVANDLAAKAFVENAKLSLPADTGAKYGEALIGQANLMTLCHGGRAKIPEPPVVLDEPFKVPDLPTEVKKATQKRKENEGGDGKPNKKRHLQHDRQLQQHQQQQIMSNEDLELLPPEQRPSPRTLQQRYFYQQHQKHKQRLASNSKKNLANAMHNHTGGPGGGAGGMGGGALPVAGKRVAAPAKSGRRKQQQLLQQQKHQQQQQLQKVLLPGPPPEQQQQQQMIPNHLVVQPHVEYILDEALRSVGATTTPPTTATPNPTLNANSASVTPCKLKPLPQTARVVYGPTTAGELGSPNARGFANSPIIFKEKPTAAQPATQLSTPVKKYIVEERQPTTTPTSPVISTANLPLAPQIISVQQIPAPPLGTKLRPVAGVVGSPSTGNSGSQPTTVSKLTPKKIQLLETASGNETQAKAQAKTLATGPTVRVLPYTEQTAAAAAQLAIVGGGSPKDLQRAGGVTPLSSASTVNIIKNIPASSLNNTLITPLATPTATVTPLFRGKQAASINIKAATPAGASTSTQLLTNIKLTTGTGGGGTSTGHLNIKPLPSGALRNIKICSPNGKLFLQSGKLPAGSIIHKLNNASGVPAATGAAVVGGGTVNAHSPTGNMLSPTSPQSRIPIQKMQILTPTQVISSAGSGSGTNTVTSSNSSNSSASSSNAKIKPTTLTFATAGVGKNNLVFLPASATSTMRAVTLTAAQKPKTAAVTPVAGGSEQLLGGKTNVVVIGATSSTVPGANTTTAGPTTASCSSASSTTQSSTKVKPNQLITEDTPIDIINMPIIVADNGTTTETKTVGGKSTPLVVFNATDWEMELDQASKVTATTSNSTASQSLEDVIIEEDEEQDTEQLNNRIIELNPEDESAIEYVDMELEQPIEIDSASSSSISPAEIAASTTTTTTTSLKASIVPALSQQPQQKQHQEQQPLGAAGAASRL
ncbi:uncharacterized protein Dwil_GK24815 [Drosophila willistoni]|uniref:ENT domain-containing protein n=1 Tax=Drosophila willistoni TaxID=7260 RepID=B4N195_DROWI|nr:uncharacterized protein Dwil_GK24815 [Drosophila willistoni]